MLNSRRKLNIMGSILWLSLVRAEQLPLNLDGTVVSVPICSVNGVELPCWPAAFAPRQFLRAEGDVHTLRGKGCVASSTRLPAGAIAVVERGACTFGQKALAAQSSGAAALLIYDHEEGAAGRGLWCCSVAT